LPPAEISMNLPALPLASAVFTSSSLARVGASALCMPVSSLSSPRRKLDANTWPPSKYATSAPSTACCSRAAFDVNA
jgi:hypothetical protein